MYKSKNLVEQDFQDKQSKMENNYEVITGINFRPSWQLDFKNRSLKRKMFQNTADLAKLSVSKTPILQKNLKPPIVIQADTDSEDEPVEFVSKISANNIQIAPDSFENINRSFVEDSSPFERTNISELSINDSQNVQLDVESSTHDIYNLEKENGNMPEFYCLKNKVLVILKPETTFWFCGKLKVQVLYGTIKMYGTAVNSSETLEVYSPKSHSLVGIETEINTSNCDMEKLWKALVAEGVNRNVESSLVLTINQCQPGWAIVLLENLINHLTTFLNAFYSFKLFPKIEDQTFYLWNDPRRAEVILQTNFRFCKTGKQLTINPEWRTKIVDRILDECSHKQQQSINLIFGGKSVGKSTFSRYLVNSILSKSSTIIFVNLDPGQTECAPSGCISLNLIDKPFLGPNFTELRTPYYQLYIGDINVANCVTRYLEAVKILVDRLKSDLKISNFPVVVNTMGFCKGIGWDIAISIIRNFQPTNVIQIISKKPKNNFEKHLTKETVTQQKFLWTVHESDNKQNELSYTLHRINSEAEMHGTGETFNMQPYQKRDLVMLAYLSKITKGKRNIESFNCTILNINDIPPYKVPLPSIYLSLTQTGVPLTHVLAAMNGNIVALCGYNPSAESNNSSTHSSSENSQVLIRTPLSTCYGFGIIRGIDIEQKFLYINTPLSPKELQFVNCLVDCLPIPTALLPLNLPNAPYTGNKADLPTSKEPRRGFFRMRNQTLQT